MSPRKYIPRQLTSVVRTKSDNLKQQITSSLPFREGLGVGFLSPLAYYINMMYVDLIRFVDKLK